MQPQSEQQDIEQPTSEPDGSAMTDVTKWFSARRPADEQPTALAQTQAPTEQAPTEQAAEQATAEQTPAARAQPEHVQTEQSGAEPSGEQAHGEPGNRPSPKPGFGERGRMRRRARFLRKARELAYRDLGGLVFDLHRFGQRNDQIVLAKLATLGQIDSELRAIEQALHEIRPVTVLREVGIGACPRCAALHGSEDRFCPGCGMAFAASAERPLSTTPVTPGTQGVREVSRPAGLDTSQRAQLELRDTASLLGPSAYGAQPSSGEIASLPGPDAQPSGEIASLPGPDAQPSGEIASLPAPAARRVHQDAHETASPSDPGPPARPAPTGSPGGTLPAPAHQTPQLGPGGVPDNDEDGRKDSDEEPTQILRPPPRGT